MKKTILATALIIALAITTTTNAQVGIGVSTANIHPSAQLDVSSTTKGFLPPRMTLLQRNAINNPAAGLLVYQTDGVSGYYYFDGAVWKSGLVPQGQVGPAGLSATTTMASSGSLPFFGSSGTFALTPSPNNVYINAGSYISIGTNNTSQYFYVSNKLDDNTITIAKTTMDAGFSWPVNATVALVGPLGPNGPQGQAGINGSDATISIGAIGTATTNGATINSGVLSLAPADESNGGIVTNTAQTFAGKKTFNSDLIVNGVTIGTGSGSINNNTAIGNASLAANTTGTYNTANGSNALNNNLSGSTNTANGAYSLYNNTTGYQNTAIGASSLASNSTANQNTAIGFGALQSVASGSRNTALGYNADVISTYLSNATAIGAGALVTENNTIQLGDINVTNVVTSGQYTGSGFKTPTGTNTQYLMADGSTSDGLTATISAMQAQIANLQMQIAAIQTDAYVLNPAIIGNQIWTSRNLNVSTYRNGDPIPQVTDPTVWAGLTTGAWCYYNNDPANGAIFGKLYNWYAVNDPRGLAPTGYHIPTDAEWTTLTTTLGSGSKTKMKSTSGWSNNGNGTNSSGFNGLPGSFCNLYGTFGAFGNEGFWWSSTESDAARGFGRFLRSFSVSNDLGYYNDIKTSGFSVRCIKD